MARPTYVDSEAADRISAAQADPTENPRGRHRQASARPPRPTTDPPLAYRPNSAAQMLGIGRTRIYELIRAGQLATRKLGPVTLIERSELERFLASLPVGGPEPGDGTP